MCESFRKNKPSHAKNKKSNYRPKHVDYEEDDLEEEIDDDDDYYTLPDRSKVKYILEITELPYDDEDEIEFRHFEELEVVKEYLRKKFINKDDKFNIVLYDIYNPRNVEVITHKSVELKGIVKDD